MDSDPPVCLINVLALPVFSETSPDRGPYPPIYTVSAAIRVYYGPLKETGSCTMATEKDESEAASRRRIKTFARSAVPG